MPQRDPFDGLERFLEHVTGNANRALGGGVAVDLRDEGEAFVLVVDLPGVGASDVDLTVEDRTVTVAADREDPADDDERYLLRERRRGNVERGVTVPDPIEQDEADATIDDGVLTVRLPKRGGTTGTTIDVE